MSLKQLIFEKTGLRLGLDRSGVDQDAQVSVAALLVLVARSDGGISPDESVRMVELLRQRFGVRPGEAVSLINRATDELAHRDHLDEAMQAANDSLNPKQKKDLMHMVLEVIASDDRKHAAEMKLLVALMDGLDLSDAAMGEVYDRYFNSQNN